MSFVGVPLSQLLTAFAIAGGLVVVLYILKLRRRPVPVPFSRIWQRILRDKEATSLFSQLKRLLSLLLQLALLALLLLALGDPRTAQNVIEGRNVVVLVDASASMQATDVAPSRLESGKSKLRDLVRGMGGSDRMLIAQMDATITPLSTLSGEVSELEAALAAVKPSDGRADFQKALRFATDTLSGLPNPEIIVVSDGVLAQAPEVTGPIPLEGVKLSYIPTGERSKNAAITGFSVRRYPLDKSRYEVMLEVTNTSADELDLELSLYGDGLVTDVQKLKLKPGERLPRFYPNLSGASRTLEARLAMADGTHDDLPADDRAYALMPERRRARVQVVTPGNMYLEAALLLDEYLDVTTISPSQYPSEGQFDVTIFDNVSPTVAAGSGSVLYLNPGKDNVPFGIDKVVEDTDPNVRLGFDEIQSEHPIVRYTQLGDVNVARASILKPNKEDKVIASSFKGPLLIAGRRAGQKFVALGFDVRESDFPLRIAWPLFLLNTINDFVEEDTGYISSFATGTVWRIPAPSGATEATLIDPSGVRRTIPVHEGRAVFLGQRAGVYTLESATGDGTAPPETSMFAANLSDPVESKIEPVKELKVAESTFGPPSSFVIGVRREIWVYLLILALAITAIEWLTYHRRITV